MNASETSSPRPAVHRLTSAGFALALAGGTVVAVAGPAQADPNPNITICHATGNPGKWVIQTIDAAAITQQGHDQHQDKRDVIPPFEYVSENTQEKVSFSGLNWTDNWEVNAEGVAQEDVVEADCPGKKPPTSPTPTGTPTTTPTKPVVETDGANPAGVDFRLVGAGSALVLAGGAALVLLNRRRGLRS